MTNEQLKLNGLAMIALSEGRPIQVFYEDRWNDTKTPPEGWIDWNSCCLRPKPAPVTRPWSKPEDVPAPVCWIRNIGSSTQRLLLQMDATGVCAGYSMVDNSQYLIVWGEILQFEHSTDLKTWKPCTVEVSE